MSTAEATRQYTPDELLVMPDGDQYELVDGQLVERDMGWEASWISGIVFYLLYTHSTGKNLGWVVPSDASYQCFADPRKVRKPDVSFIRIQRLSTKELPRGHCRIAPDLAVEVISPHEPYERVEEKVEEYREARVSLIWVVNPLMRSVRVHRADGTVSDLGENDQITGEDVIPGFRCRVGDFFRTPAAPTDG